MKQRSEIGDQRSEDEIPGDDCPDEIRPSTIFRTYGVNFARHGHEFHGVKMNRMIPAGLDGWKGQKTEVRRLED